MSPRAMVAVCVMTGACGGPSAAKPAAAPSSLVLHTEAAGYVHNGLGFAAGADIGFEVTGCCGVALYGSRTTLANAEQRIEHNDDRGLPRDGIKDILEAGVELGMVMPDVGASWLENRLRLRARVGKAGTAPDRPFIGRAGYSGSGALLIRVLGAEPPEANEAGGNVDLLFGYHAWSLGRERTPAGAFGDAGGGGAFVFGIRLGADYGADFE